MVELDPVADHREISLGVSAHDFAWDTVQALSFALFRTYAVPSIGGLLDRTGSRPAVRQADGMGGPVRISHPGQLRAIPNNAILQQLGWPASARAA